MYEWQEPDPTTREKSGGFWKAVRIEGNRGASSPPDASPLPILCSGIFFWSSRYLRNWCHCLSCGPHPESADDLLNGSLTRTIRICRPG